MNVGIVCEFNPFHNGHAYLIKKAKEISGGNIICCMSGNFVQRGEYAFSDKYVRAKWAVENGADAVFETPFPFSCATAEKFALGAISVLVKSGFCDALAFGCEKEISEDELYAVAQLLLSEDFSSSVRKRVKTDKNISFAFAREKELEERLGKEKASLVASPNSLLAVEYAKACLYFGKKIKLFPILRQGASHDGEPCGIYASASSIRKDKALCEKYCPENVKGFFSLNESFKIDKEKYYSCLSQRILYGEREDMENTAELPHEYALKIKKALSESDSFDSFFEKLKSKHITEAKLRRMLLYLATHTKKEQLDVLPESAMLLGVSPSGAKLIKAYKKGGHDFEILSKISDIKKLPPCEKERYEKQLVAEKLFERLKSQYFAVF